MSALREGDLIEFDRWEDGTEWTLGRLMERRGDRYMVALPGYERNPADYYARDVTQVRPRPPVVGARFAVGDRVLVKVGKRRTPAVIREVVAADTFTVEYSKRKAEDGGVLSEWVPAARIEPNKGS